jgi:mRNA-degrading endonuclease RelE of RelBE toxin-antitoxin system
MPGPEPFWNIRFAATVRQMFSRIPRGEAARFDAAIQLLRYGSTGLPNLEQVDGNIYQYSYNGYRIAFEIVQDAKTTVRVIAFKPEAENE